MPLIKAVNLPRKMNKKLFEDSRWFLLRKLTLKSQSTFKKLELPVAMSISEINLVLYPSSEFFTTVTTIILGDAATDEIMVAWKEGYFFLANTFINLESQIKKEQLDRLDGWNGFEKASISCPEKPCLWHTIFTKSSFLP